jgi:hypothetical protein
VPGDAFAAEEGRLMRTEDEDEFEQGRSEAKYARVTGANTPVV